MRFFKFLSTKEEYEDDMFGKPNPSNADRMVFLMNSLKQSVEDLDKNKRETIDYLRSTLEELYKQCVKLSSERRELIEELDKCRRQLNVLEGANND